MLEFRSKDERNEMSATAQTMMRDYAGTRWPSLNHKGRMARLAGVLGFGHRRVRSIYQNEPGLSLRADEMAAIAALREQKIEEANRNAFQDLQARIARLEAALFAQDEEFHHEQVAAFRAAADGGRRENVPGSDGQGRTGTEG
jgi:hypothetical protein